MASIEFGVEKLHVSELRTTDHRNRIKRIKMIVYLDFRNSKFIYEISWFKPQNFEDSIDGRNLEITDNTVEYIDNKVSRVAE